MTIASKKITWIFQYLFTFSQELFSYNLTFNQPWQLPFDNFEIRKVVRERRMTTFVEIVRRWNGPDSFWRFRLRRRRTDVLLEIIQHYTVVLNQRPCLLHQTFNFSWTLLANLCFFLTLCLGLVFPTINFLRNLRIGCIGLECCSLASLVIFKLRRKSIDASPSSLGNHFVDHKTFLF